MITKILISMYSLNLLYALANKFKLLLISNFSNQPLISAALTQLENSMKVASKAINRAKKNPFTQLVRDADKKRDNLYIALKNHIISGVRRSKVEYRTACMELLPIFEQNNIYLYSLGDQEETAAIDSLISDLNNENSKNHLSTINALELLQELDEANKEFVQISSSRNSSKAKNEIKTNKDAFDQLDNSLELVCSALKSMLAMGEPKEIKEIIAEANQYIKEANTIARLSGKRNGGDKEDNQSEE